MPENTESTAYTQAAAQMRSVVAMVAALECDYERLQDLRESVRHYTAGTNMPGFMPDNMPETFETAAEARAYIAEDMRRDAEDMPEDSEAAAYLRERADTLESLATECAAADFGETFETANGSRHYWIAYDSSPTAGLDSDDAAELAELIEAAGDCESEDDARDRIAEDALSVEVRSGWHTFGETPEPEEFRIVLCTGGPHVEIRGYLSARRARTLQFALRRLGRPWRVSRRRARYRRARNLRAAVLLWRLIAPLSITWRASQCRRAAGTLPEFME